MKDLRTGDVWEGVGVGMRKLQLGRGSHLPGECEQVPWRGGMWPCCNSGRCEPHTMAEPRLYDPCMQGMEGGKGEMRGRLRRGKTWANSLSLSSTDTQHCPQTWKRDVFPALPWWWQCDGWCLSMPVWPTVTCHLHAYCGAMPLPYASMWTLAPVTMSVTQ